MSAYSLEDAIKIAKQLKKGLEVAGPRYFSPPFSDIQLCNVIFALTDGLGGQVERLQEELTLTKRQNAAANARSVKAEKNSA